MIPEELRIFIEQNCSGKEPSDLIHGGYWSED